MTVALELGFHITISETVRLYGINAPEVRGSEKVAGLEARDALRNLVAGKKLRITTMKDKKEKYGRYLATVWTLDDKGNPAININDWLVQNGHAVLTGR